MTKEIIACAFGVVLHAIFCILVYVGIRQGVLKVKKHLMPVVIFIPVWGIVCVLLLHFKVFLPTKKEIRLEKWNVYEEIYRNIVEEANQRKDEIVPLEEALLLNKSELRRNLMIDILYENSEEYVELLHQARQNEDIEVVHYATTAMAELSKEYDIGLQKLEQEYRKNPEDISTLESYCEFLGEYIAQGFIQGRMLEIQRNQYNELLSKMIIEKPSLDLYQKLTENLMELEDYSSAAEQIKSMEKIWPNQESVIFLKIRYYAQQGQGKMIQQLIRQIEERHVYLSAQGKEMLAFWKSTEGKMKRDQKKTSL